MLHACKTESQIFKSASHLAMRHSLFRTLLTDIWPSEEKNTPKQEFCWVSYPILPPKQEFHVILHPILFPEQDFFGNTFCGIEKFENRLLSAPNVI